MMASSEGAKWEHVHDDNNVEATTTFGPFLDYLLLNYYGVLREEVVELFQRNKLDLRERGNNGVRVPFPELAGGDVWLSASTPEVKIADPRKYSYFFRNEIFCGALTTRKGLPSMRLRFHTCILYEQNLDELEALSNEVAGHFFKKPDKIQVSRVDFAVDFQHPDFKIPDEEDKVTRAAGYDRNMNKDNGMDAMTLNRNSKKMQAQLYNKSAKIKAEGQEFMHGVYEKLNGYDNSLPVFRMEFRYERGLLRELKLPNGQERRKLGIETISDLKGSLGDLTRLAVGNEENGFRGSWVRFCPPETRGRDNRPPAAWWEAVAKKFRSDMPVSGRIRHRPGSNPSFTHDRMMMVAYCARFAAHLKLQNPSSNVSLIQFPSEFQPHLSRELSLKGTTWAAEVEKKRDQLQEKLEPNGLFSGAA